eukprot:TRINITY_DN73941_c0_g1_i1.p1 TRINITY_DN73941_c0_g1~~TRINITY_DN73941_c0_g1_i1.p1  ORF type:complete len:303 (-),score=26.47 TRINITY_DN73941_c0_g1_i1:465-1286(-)
MLAESPPGGPALPRRRTISDQVLVQELPLRALVERSADGKLLQSVSADTSPAGYGVHPLLTTCLRLGALSEPDSLVVLFHGLACDAASLRNVAEAWSARTPSTQYVLMQAQLPHRRGGFDWFAFPRRREDYPSDEAYLNEVVIPSVLRCKAEVSFALDCLQKELNLSNDRVVLAGFSQGAAVAAYTGLSRGVAGVIPMGGPCPPRPQLLPDPKTTRTKVCVISGYSDSSAPAQQLVEAFSPFDGGVHIIRDVGHRLVEDHVLLGGYFLEEIFR